MKQHIQTLIAQSLQTLQESEALPPLEAKAIHLERTRDPNHGDFATNVALNLAKLARRKPRELAQLIVSGLPLSNHIAKTEIAGPGFINFFLSSTAYHDVVRQIVQEGERYGQSELGRGVRVQVEFVSANPTGPLHVGHGRGAAFGASLANLLRFVGYQVECEYYVNDAGRQMDILAASVWLRYLQGGGLELPFPDNGYRGDYVNDIAQRLIERHGDELLVEVAELRAELPPDSSEGGDKERHIDALIQRAKALLGEERYRLVFQHALESVLTDIRQDLAAFGVVFERWYSEAELVASNAVSQGIIELQERGHVEERDGALWFRSTAWGDEKDRVVQRENGQTTYFASDIAYHRDKFQRGFERVINIWGADHHGYIARVKAALAASDIDPERLTIMLVQFVNLYRSGERAAMSTRSGEFVTLRELREEVGNDAARLFYVWRKPEQHLDFDLDLAKSQSKENPVYYIQYAHARICSMLRRAHEQNLSVQQARGAANLTRLTHERERALMVNLARFPEVVEAAALSREPHTIAHYLNGLATDLHKYYDHEPRITILDDDEIVRDARLVLCLAVQRVLRNGLALLGVSAPEVM